jgi:flagellar biosynthetic protein FlhB|uniref:Flagellar biosynthetic protein FlhB n=1 Tax=Mesoaciditoga lauensis TaxID=1495039 RepID=A0A7V3VT22_9BACT
MRIDLNVFADPEKTERATPHRRQKAREEGQVAQSKDLNAAVALLAVSTVVYYTFGGLYSSFSRLLFIFTNAFSGSGTMSVSDSMSYLVLAFSSALGWLAMIMVAGVVGAAVPSLLQTRFSFSMKALTPNLSKINPIEGIKKLFSVRSLFEFFKSLLKLIVIAYVGYVTIVGQWNQYLSMSQADLQSSSIFLGNMIYQLFLKLGLVLLAIGFIDIFYQRWDYERSLRMTKKEVKDEMKDYEGSPIVKRKQREQMLMIARSRMMQNIRNADVVVTNPTHIAVAMEYKEDMNAPRVIAKGAGEVAERIKAIASKYGIPILVNPQLAREIFRSVDIGDEIPSRLYRAVAELLVTIYKMKNAI